MQVKFFTIPIMGGEAVAEEMNTFLRSKKVLQVEHELVSDRHGTAWCFFVKFLEESSATGGRERGKVDYRQVLDEETFKRFAALRAVRKQVAEAEDVPAYIVFTDEELAELAKLDAITPSAMRTIKGIGEKKVEKYARHFQNPDGHEAG